LVMFVPVAPAHANAEIEERQGPTAQKCQRGLMSSTARQLRFEPSRFPIE
jgi:hypothetical protein